MTLDWLHFTPFSALIGGALIGLSASLFVLLNGRIAGVSGIIGGLLRPKRGDLAWRIAFVIGIGAAPATYQLFSPLPDIHVNTGTGLLILAGFLVGIGTRYGAGCTSGHGVCGLSRLSFRSFVATLIFMTFGAAAVFVVRHGLGW